MNINFTNICLIYSKYTYNINISYRVRKIFQDKKLDYERAHVYLMLFHTCL